MEIFGKSVRVSISVIILIILFVLVILIAIVYFGYDNQSGKWGTVLGSLFAGFIVAIIQFIIAWQDFKKTERLNKLELIEVLYNRADKKRYEVLIGDTKLYLDVMGVTAIRFFNDFADTSTGAVTGATVLIEALKRGVKVRVLLPSIRFLPEQKRTDAERVRDRCEDLSNLFPNLIEVRYFEHTATHSIFRMDDTCIVGPVFPNLESRNTPALYLKNTSPVAVEYIKYFDIEWKSANNSFNA